MAYEALIFDLDGTLWNTLQPVTDAWNQVAEEKAGLPKVTPAQIQSVMGMSHEEAFAKLLPGVAPEKREGPAQAFYRKEVSALNGNYLYPGVAEGLEALSKKYTLFLVSNCQPEYLARFQALTGLGRLFRDQECYGATGKPKGDNISLVMRRNKLTKGAYIGDTAGDQIASRQAGQDYYHVTYGFGSPSGDCMHFHSFHEVSAFFLAL
jgi:phosphoglycolate phosphatase